MKKYFLALILFFNAGLAFSQSFEIRHQKGMLFITHQVAPKESLFSLGRLYYLSVKDIAVANKLKINSGLTIGQSLKIPLNKNNFIQGSQGKKDQLAPVFCKIKQGDNLYQISKRFNNVSQDHLKKWNDLPAKAVVKAGQVMIVGYIKYSVTGNMAVKEEKEISADPATSKNLTEHKPVIADIKPVEANNQQVESKDLALEASNYEAGAGYFASAFSINVAGSELKNIFGAAATFKSTSGWSDGKYYLLVNGIATETIVKVTANGKTIYAKVLESLPILKDNNALVCRLSNAAASALGITDPKFNVELVYNE